MLLDFVPQINFLKPMHLNYQTGAQRHSSQSCWLVFNRYLLSKNDKAAKIEVKVKMSVINSTLDIYAEKAIENAKQEKEEQNFSRVTKRKLKFVKENSQMNFEENDSNEDVPGLYCNEIYSRQNLKSLSIRNAENGPMAPVM